VLNFDLPTRSRDGAGLEKSISNPNFACYQQDDGSDELNLGDRCNVNGADRVPELTSSSVRRT
jgi:hypothetical protein